jgi:uncharacterized membrane protein
MSVPVSLAEPLVAVLGVGLVLAMLVLSRAARHHRSLRRRRASLVLRTLVVACLALALAGLRLELPVDRLTTVFVVDLSDSVGADGHRTALGFVRDAIEARPGGDQAAVVAFGRDALVERLPAELEELDAIASVPARTATDVGGALRLASALFPDETQKRIVLVSDGNDTTGRGQSEAALAAARGVRIDTVAVGLGGADEVIVTRLETPDTAHVGEGIEAIVSISSTVAQPATVRLFADGAQVGVRSDVPLAAGLTRVSFVIEAAEAGFHTFRAVVEAERDTFSQNDRADSDTIVKGDPRILLVAGSALATDDLVEALRLERQDIDVVAADAMPADLARLASYDSVILADVPAEALGAERMAALQVLVRDVGRGLVMIGGEDAYGAGGYGRTPLEETLPVEMDVRDRTRQPDIALVVVIDESGSMDACHCNTANRDRGSAIAGVPKVDIGKEAILRAVAALTERDEFGVVAFNENAHWVVRTAPLGSVGDVSGQLGAIRANGQTNILAGLTEAVASLEGTSAERRHIVLLTDGWSSSGEYTDLLLRMKAAGITLSAVGAGGGGANEFLADLAEQGGGRFWPAANPASIPDIFLKETQQAAGQRIVEEAFFPVRTGDSPILDGLDAGLPQLLGYNGSTLKAAAQSVLVTGRADPLLATWQYGLGRAVAWTSDASGRWAARWVGWDGFARFFSQLVSWTFPGEETGGIEAELVPDGDEMRLRLRSVEADGSPRDFYDTTARITSPAMDALSVRLEQVAPGTYEARLGALEAGAYAMRIDQLRPGDTPLGRTLVLVAPTPAEYRLVGTNEPLLAALRSATGGAALAGEDAPRAAWTHDVAATTAARDLWPWLLLGALVLWPLDVGVRRVSIGRRDVALARAWWVERWRRWRAPATRTALVDAMLGARGRAAGGRSRDALLRPGAKPGELGATPPALAEPVGAASTPRVGARPPSAGPAATPAAPPSPAATPGATPGAPAAGPPARAAAPTARAAALPARAAGQRPAPAPRVPSDTAPPAGASGGDTLERLHEAKRRARR